MTDNRDGAYIAATDAELKNAGLASRGMALLNQRVPFRHRGEASLRPGRLELRDWQGGEPLIVTPGDLTDVQRAFTELYGRFVGGGSAEWGAPIILSRTESRPALYLLFEHRAFLEKSANVEWHLALLEWRRHRTA
jgi:hypothetical protein